MSGSSRRTGKQAAIDELAQLGGIARPTSPGGTVPTRWLIELTEALYGRQPEDGPISKAHALARLALSAGLDPVALPLAAGATVPGETLWGLVDAIVVRQDSLPSQIALLESPTIPNPLPNASEELQEALDNLAQLLRELSEHEGDLPPDFAGQTIDLVEPEEIDWAQNGWMATLSMLQGWLRLDDTWNPGADTAKNAAFVLFDLLGAEIPGECFGVESEAVILSETGVDLLTLCLDAACAQKRVFTTALEDGESRTFATRRWRDAWDEAASFDSDEPLDVHASVDTWKLKDFVDVCEAETLELNPSYQRDAVWPDKNSQGLIDSILRGIPLPSIILNQREGTDIMEIVDGKQRLTAILRFIGRHPDGVRHAQEIDADSGKEEMRTNYRKWARKHGVKAREARESFLPFALAKVKDKNDPLHRFSGRFYSEISSQRVRISGKEVSIRSIFEGAQKDYQIPVIQYQNTAINQIQRVFGLYNSQGKQLNQEELRNAVYHHLDVARLMLVLSGDHNRAEVSELLPTAVIGEAATGVLRSLFEALNVGLNRFHCSKLTGWTMAFICYEPRRKASGEYALPSTASYINALLDQVNKSNNHELRGEDGLSHLMGDLTGGAELLFYLHDEEEAISEGFTSKKPSGSGKWDDLPTTAALVACSFASAAGVHPDSLSEDAVEAVAEATASADLRPPDKQQTKTQWRYLAKTVLALLDALEVDTASLTTLLNNRYGSTGLSALLSLETD